jgi:RNA polymerase sigma-70 factor, ECF subfamily
VINLTDAQWQNLYRYGVALTGHQRDALGLLHSAMERWQRVTRTQALDPETYLRTVMRNLQSDRWRSAQRQPAQLPLPKTDHKLAEVGSTGDQILETLVIQRAQLTALWDQLAPDMRDLLYLWAWLGFTAQEMAEELKLPMDTVLANIRHLHQRLLTDTTTE